MANSECSKLTVSECNTTPCFIESQAATSGELLQARKVLGGHLDQLSQHLVHHLVACLARRCDWRLLETAMFILSCQFHYLLHNLMLL